MMSVKALRDDGMRDNESEWRMAMLEETKRADWHKVRADLFDAENVKLRLDVSRLTQSLADLMRNVEALQSL